MTQYLLDTDAVIDHLIGVRSCVALIASRQAAGGRVCTSDVVIAEVYAGLHAAHRVNAERLLGAFAYLPTPLSAARQAPEWRTPSPAGA